MTSEEHRAEMRKYAREHRSHLRAYKREWGRRNRDKQHQYNRNWYAKHMSRDAVRKKHYRQNMKWRVNHPTKAQQSFARSALGTWFQFTNDKVRLQTVAGTARKRIAHAKSSVPVKLSPRARVRSPSVVTLHRYGQIIVNLAKETSNRQLLGLIKSSADKRLSEIKK